MQKEEKHVVRKIFNLCLEIQSVGRGENGFPYVHFETTNYGYDAIVWIVDNGFVKGCSFDGFYCLFEGPETNRNCINHLKRLLKAIKEDKPCTEA